MSISTSPELFINMKSIPDKTSQEYDAFFEEELKKIEYGLTIDSVYIPGEMYFHCCHWNIYIDQEDPVNKIIKRTFTRPLFRDNEWLIFEARLKAIEQRMGLLLVGSRRLAKSEVEASIIGRASTIYRGSENVISAGNDKDLKLIWDKIDKGLNSVHPYFRWSRIENDWKKQVTLGIKDKQGNKMPWSSILPRNYDDGNNTEAAAGITAKEFVIDEIGKFPFLRCLEAAIPAFTSPYGWRCSPFLTGTGGAFDKGADAEKMFLNPEAYNFLGVTVNDEPKKYGLFVPGTYRMEAKKQTTFGDFVVKRGYSIPKESELYQVSFQESDEELANQIIKKERETAKQANDQEAYLKAIMYYPLNPEECFLTASYNIFNVDAVRAQKQRILHNNITGTPVELYHNGESIQHKPVDKKPIMNYPHKASDDKDAPIVIWDFPIKNAPFGLYTAGVDPYRQGKSEYSNSLGAVYIFKRIHSITGEHVQNQIVASYVARPDNKEKWNEQARLLIKYYNARALVENDEMSFIDYMVAKGDEHYLEPEPGYLKSLIKSSTVNRPYGIHRSAGAIRDFLNIEMKRYFDEVVKVEKAEDGSVIREVTNTSFVYDPMLLEEIAKFNEDDNFDRVIACSLAISLGRYLNRTIGVISTTESDPRLKSLYNKEKKGSTLFPEVRKIRGRSSSIKRLFG